jgi:hypothetical protein
VKALRGRTEGVRRVVMDSESDSSKEGSGRCFATAGTETPKTERRCGVSMDGFLGRHGCCVLRQLQPEPGGRYPNTCRQVGFGQGPSERKKRVNSPKNAPTLHDSNASMFLEGEFRSRYRCLTQKPSTPGLIPRFRLLSHDATPVT